MRRNIVFAQLVIFAVISVSIVAYTVFGVIGADPTANPIRVTVRLSTGGGVFTGSEVAFRGVGVGRVEDVQLRPDVVLAHLRIDEGTRIPDDSVAHVYDLSVAGEQYVDLVPPARHSSSVLRSGDVIPAQRTTTPLPVADVLLDVQRLVTSISPGDVRVISRELANAFAGAGPALRQLLSSSTSLVQQLSDSQDAMLRLVRNGRVVLDTVAAHSGDFRTFAESLRSLTATLKQQTPTLEKLIGQAPDTTRLLDGVVTRNSTAAGVLLGNLVTFGDIQVANLPGLRGLLVAVPEFGQRLPLVTRGGTIHAAAILNYSQRVCSYGVPMNSPLSPARSPLSSGTCTVDLPRGAADVPGATADAGTDGSGATALPTTALPGGAGAAAAGGTRVTSYDPASGVVTTPDGRTVRLGWNGGQAALYGDRSWETLLAPTGVAG